MGERDTGALRFGAECLASALAHIPTGAWSIPSNYRDNGVHHRYQRVVLVNSRYRNPHAELFDFVLSVMHPVRDMTLSKLDPGGFIAPHRDAGPWFERWQVPIATSGQWHGGGATPAPGVAFRVRHWESHAVTNRGPGSRIHLVIDRDISIQRDPLPFATFSIPQDMSDLVDRSRQ